jgi:hypothetical protein
MSAQGNYWAVIPKGPALFLGNYILNSPSGGSMAMPHMAIGDSQGLCETTSTERFFNPWCSCPTYPGNLGPCKTWEMGGNGRCVYCDHEVACHSQLRGDDGKFPGDDIKLVRDVCRCLRFRNEHDGGSGDSKRTHGACNEFYYIRRLNADLDMARWLEASGVSIHRKKKR